MKLKHVFLCFQAAFFITFDDEPQDFVIVSDYL